MEELRVRDIKSGEVVYGCAFNIDFDRNSWYGGQVVHNICKPVKGMVKKYEDSDSYGRFYLLKRDGSPRQSGMVSTESRHFARTYDECVEIYNQLVRKKQEKLRNIVDELEKELL
ncbi:hypothetical protein FYJ38_00335 [Clostridium sp. WB02_MRS01]|uniref:hypothetical protein n=1 Tax=Clostridium sp. WB02_MRS01 TaxID=2605777 RepID=UPI0012B30A97|nr:hypothetical protein [Clostridium sp. WB02_MRS01]MSS07086.1 hypothetical protein [Clostridium sp. WB02_MRS01]